VIQKLFLDDSLLHIFTQLSIWYRKYRVLLASPLYVAYAD